MSAGAFPLSGQAAWNAQAAWVTAFSPVAGSDWDAHREYVRARRVAAAAQYVVHEAPVSPEEEEAFAAGTTLF